MGECGDFAPDSLKSSTMDSSGKYKLPIDLNLCGQEFDDEIVDQYGQLLGEYSKLDHGLWLTAPPDNNDDDQSLAFCGEGIQWNVESSSSHSNGHIANQKPSERADNSLTDGSMISVENNSSSLNESSQNQSLTFSPVSVLQRRSICNKRARSKHRHPAKDCSRFSSVNSMESFVLDGTTDSCTDTLVRTRKMTDLLQLNSSGKSPNPTTMPNLEVAKKCVHCDSAKTPQWRDGPLGRKTLCNACGIQYKKGKLPSDSHPLIIVKPLRSVGKKCVHCESGMTPQWRDGPLGRKTLCNACGLQFRKGVLSSDYRPMRTGRFDSSPPPTDFSTIPAKNPVHDELDHPVLHSSELDWVEGISPILRRDSLPVEKGWQTHECSDRYQKTKVQAMRMAENSEINHDCARKAIVTQDMTWEPSDMMPDSDFDSDADPDPDFKPTHIRRKKIKLPDEGFKKCAHCESSRTPQWREGPLGRKTLCNACGVQFRHGRLFPEYRPLKSPTYNQSLHSHLPKKVEQMRLRKLGEAPSTSDGNKKPT